jgi:hypothetical protein
MATMGPEERERFARREEFGTTPGSPRPEREPESKTLKAVAGGSLTEAVCGAAAVVLAIIGLAGALPPWMASIATIAFGVALLAEGGAVAARYRSMLHEVSGGERTELGGGMGAEFLAGGAGVVLGILGLIGLAPATLIPIAVLAFGGALLLGSGSTMELGLLRAPGAFEERYAHVTRQATVAASGAQVLIGLAAIVLGIIALVGIDPITLSLVALLVLGASVLFSGGAITSRLGNVLRSR